MAKRPRPGAVKTRLAAELGDTTASLLYEAFLADTLAACAGTSAATMIAFAPPTEAEWFRQFAPGALLTAQPEGSFGERLEAALVAGFAAGFAPVAVIGSDIPHLGSETIEAGLAAVGQGRAALVPTTDGGYCLLALGAPEPRLFQDIEWSSGRELEQTIKRIHEAGLELTVLAETFDIDTGADLQRLKHAISSGEAVCPLTARVLTRSTEPLSMGMGLVTAEPLPPLALRSDIVPTPPDELYLETTNRCNLRCRTCPQYWGMEEDAADLSPEQVRRILGYFPAVRRVVLHGIGEPLLNPKLPAILREVKGAGAHALFNTNGLLLRGRASRGLVEEGLDELRVSVDSATAETYATIRGVNGLGRIIANIRAFSALKQTLGRDKPEVSLWLTGMKTNIRELPTLVGLAAEIGVSQVHLQRLVYSGRGLALRDESLFGVPDAAELAAVRQAEDLAAQLGVALRGSGEVGPGSLLAPGGREDRPYQRCRRPWTLMYVTANGNVLPCCIAPFTGVPYGSIVLGNIFKQTVEEIWNGERYRRWRTSMVDGNPPAACAGCGANWSL